VYVSFQTTVLAPYLVAFPSSISTSINPGASETKYFYLQNTGTLATGNISCTPFGDYSSWANVSPSNISSLEPNAASSSISTTITVPTGQPNGVYAVGVNCSDGAQVTIPFYIYVSVPMPSVGGGGAAPAIEIPVTKISVEPIALNTSITLGEVGNATILLTNVGTQTVNVSITSTKPWIQPTKTFVTLSRNESENILIIFSGFTAEDYFGKIVFKATSTTGIDEKEASVVLSISVPTQKIEVARQALSLNLLLFLAIGFTVATVIALFVARVYSLSIITGVLALIMWYGYLKM